MLKFDTILGLAGDPALHERLHGLEHRGAVETIVLEPRDMARHRLRATTDKGTDCAIALARDTMLEDGAVLLLDEARAIVVRSAVQRWLALVPRDAAAALELGYHAGNLHWRVHFEGARLMVALEGPEAAYLERVAAFLEDGRVRRADG
ncbi:MAG: urease accessory protein UreE [Proteobacteria bacterium]|nr:urease accessory protein UreE [Pseudomonadota bacterium]